MTDADHSGTDSAVEDIRERAAGDYESGVLASEDIATLLHKFDEALSRLSAIRKETIEECAKVADEHKGAASRERYQRPGRVMRFASDEARQTVADEERGEDIASELIAKAIRALAGGRDE